MRAAVAEQRGLADLVASARARSDRHTRMALLVEQQAAAIHREVDRLRSRLAGARDPVRAPPHGFSSSFPVDEEGSSLEARFAALEIEQELDQLRQRRTEVPVPQQPIELPASNSDTPAQGG